MVGCSQESWVYRLEEIPFLLICRMFQQLLDICPHASDGDLGHPGKFRVGSPMADGQSERRL